MIDPTTTDPRTPADKRRVSRLLKAAGLPRDNSPYSGHGFSMRSQSITTIVHFRGETAEALRDRAEEILHAEGLDTERWPNPLGVWIAVYHPLTSDTLAQTR